MLQNMFTKSAEPVELIVDGKPLIFNSIDDFEFALNARTSIPLDKVTEAIKATPGNLLLESNSIVVAIEKLTEIINQPAETVSGVTTRLKPINSVIFSNDNGWRNIFIALKKDNSSDSSVYKQIALKKYLQYLSNRKDLMDSLLGDQVENIEAVSLRTGELEIDDDFDNTAIKEKYGMMAMPKGEAVSFNVKEGDKIELLLANYHCKLIVRDGLKFLDPNNIEYPISIGINKVGRAKECSVRLQDTMQKISRMHLKILNHNDTKLELIDLSTYGTYYFQHPHSE
jgi:FHA domain-containing protein